MLKVLEEHKPCGAGGKYYGKSAEHLNELHRFGAYVHF